MIRQEFIENKKAEIDRQKSAKDPEGLNSMIKLLEESGLKIPQDSWNIPRDFLIYSIRAMGYELKSNVEYIGDDIAIVRYEASKVFSTFGANTLHDLFNMIWRFEQL